MQQLFDQIKQAVQGAIYIHDGHGRCIAAPPDTDILDFVFQDDFTVGFTRQLSAEERDQVISLCKYGDLVPTAMQLRRENARAEAALAAQLKTLTPQEAVDYIETNVTTLASAKTVLKIMARMLIAMRDQIWPDLPEG